VYSDHRRRQFLSSKSWSKWKIFGQNTLKGFNKIRKELLWENNGKVNQIRVNNCTLIKQRK
jgi:hypothetical protein